MAVNLPNNPANGDSVLLNGTTYVYNSTNNSWDIPLVTEATLPLTTLSVGPEATPSGDGAISYDNTTGIFTYTPPVISGGSGTTTYANTTDLPTSGVTTGAMAYVSGNNKLYLWNGTAWFNIAIVNQAPTAITGNQAAYVLATDGTPTVVTLVSTDPEGLPLTWSSSTSGDTQVGAVTNTDNVFTITPSTNEADIGTLSVTFSVTDGNNTETSVSSFVLEFVSPYWNETVLSIGTSSTNGLNNSTFIDRSTNARTVTPTGAPVQTAFHPYHTYWSSQFNGIATVDYLSYVSSGLALGSNNFTFETYVYFNEVGRFQSIFEIGDTLNGTSGSNTNFGFRVTTSNVIGAFTPSQSGMGGNLLNGTTVLTARRWYHLAFVRTGGTFTIYLDGVQEAQASWSTGAFTYRGGYAHVGVRLGNSNESSTGRVQELNGNLSSLRMVVGDALYTSNFTPTEEPLTDITNTKLLLFVNNKQHDQSGNQASVYQTSNTNQIVTSNPFEPVSEYAVGENRGSAYLFQNTLDVPSSSALNLSSSDFTISCWVYLTSYPGTYSGNGAGNSALLLAKDTLNAREYTLAISGTSTSYTSISMTLFTSNTVAAAIDANYNFKLHNWYYISVVRNGVSTRIYVDGVDIGGGSSVNLQSTSTALTIGAEGAYWRGVGYEYWFRGYISDLKFVKGTALYTTNFTPPTAPVGNTNASLYLPFDNAGIFDKTGNNTLTPVGNASTSTTQTKFADTAMYFDGSGDFLVIPNNTFFQPNSGNLTWEMWINTTNITQYATLYSRTPSLFSTGMWSFMMNMASNNSGDVGLYVGDYSESAPLLQTTGVNTRDGNWHHIAVVRNESSWVLYIDGTSRDIQSWSGTITAIAASIYVGADQHYGRNFQGYIENLQILKGVAKYTANFTPPNRTQGITYQTES